MPSTYSPSLKLELIGTGEQAGTWGVTTNNNLGTLLEQAITGVVTLNMGDATYTMTNYNGLSDEARNAVLMLNGPITSPQALIMPPQQKVYIVRNRTGNSVTLSANVGGVNVSIANAASEVIFCDGSNVYSATQFNYVDGDLTVSGTAYANNIVSTYDITLGRDLFANSSTGQFYLPVGNSAVRTSSPIEGLIRYNSDLDVYEGYSNNTWVRFQTYPQGVYNINYLTVAGGGAGGGGGGAGGGGAGGLVVNSRSVDPGTVLTIIVGGGGSANGGNGSPSSLTGTVTAVGGGGGASAYGDGRSGGSGGGGGNRYYGGGSPGSGTAGQGYSGGSGAGATGDSAGGGGGGGGFSVAGGNGAGNTFPNGGAGGNGYYTTIRGTAEYYAGGGGGGSGPNGDSIGWAGGAGGQGGGGNGQTTNSNQPQAGTANTGGGGGGSGNGPGTGAAGGSGVVILSIPTAYYSGVYSGAPTIFTSGANTILTYTQSGTYTA